MTCCTRRASIQPPHAFDIGFKDLVARGAEHEAAVLARFRADGLRVAEIPESAPSAEAMAAMLAAIDDGVDVIYQGVLVADGGAGGASLLGRPDFLVRAGLLPAPDGEPRPAGAHYEVVDAKLARSAKARAVAQVAFYSDLLGRAQGIRPRWMHLALGDGEFTSLKVDDYAAYERQARLLLTQFVAEGAVNSPLGGDYPEPVEHCAICRWSERCADRRRQRRRPVADRRDHRRAAPRAEERRGHDQARVRRPGRAARAEPGGPGVAGRGAVAGAAAGRQRGCRADRV